MNADGSGVRALTTSTTSGIGNNYDAAWSPDGSRIAFTSTHDSRFSDVFVMNADGSGITRLYDTRPFDRGSTFAWSAGPAWCGDRIAFYSNRDDAGFNDIYVVNGDGTGVVRLTATAGSDIMPTWSPACDRIAFESDRDGNYEVYVINADGTGETRLTTNAAANREAAWSPDGKHIAFASNRDGKYEIYVIDADGTGEARLTANTSSNTQPTWSPDGNYIAFTGTLSPNTVDSRSQIYVMYRDGTQLVRMTDNGAADTWAAWRP